MQCGNNLKQIALACHLYNDAFKGLPPGQTVGALPAAYLWYVGGVQQYTTSNTTSPAFTFSPEPAIGPPWTCQLFAQLDQQPMDTVMTSLSMTDPVGGTHLNVPDDWEWAEDGGIGSFNGSSNTSATSPSTNWSLPLVWRCPSATPMTTDMSTWSLENLIKGNYAANFGSNTYLSDLNPATTGAFGVVSCTWATNKDNVNLLARGQGTKFAQISDGLSNTLLISELLGWDTTADGRGTWLWGGMGGCTFTAKNPPNSAGTDVLQACDTTIPASDPMFCTSNKTNGNIWVSARSNHAGGVNAALADGTVRFFTNNIAAPTWQALSTIAGGENVDPTD